MEDTALCIRLLMNALLLLCALDQKVDSASLRVEPNKLQFFQYDSLTLHCKELHGSTGWKFVHESKGELKTSITIEKTSAGLSCANKNVYPEDGGAYWCEGGGGERSNSINITVTDGSVILESPALTVEGEAATLRCRNKTNSNLAADFYKDGRRIKSSSTGEMIIHRVSESDEGLYKCRISGAGESPESRLAIVAPPSLSESPFESPSSSPTAWMVVTFLLILLLLAVGLLHLGKDHGHRVVLYVSTLISRSGSAGDQTEASAADADNATYAVVRKTKKKDKDESLCGPIYYTLGLDEPEQLGEQEESSSAAIYATPTGANPPPPEDCFYSTVQLPAE